MDTISSFQEFLELSKKPLLVIITKTKTCSVCVPVSIKLEHLLKDYPQIPLYQIFVDDVTEIQGQLLIFTVPTIVFFSEGKEILRESRFIDFNRMDRLLSNFC